LPAYALALVLQALCVDCLHKNLLRLVIICGAKSFSQLDLCTWVILLDKKKPRVLINDGTNGSKKRFLWQLPISLRTQAFANSCFFAPLIEMSFQLLLVLPKALNIFKAGSFSYW